MLVRLLLYLAPIFKKRLLINHRIIPLGYTPLGCGHDFCWGCLAPYDDIFSYEVCIDTDLIAASDEFHVSPLSMCHFRSSLAVLLIFNTLL